MHKRLQRRVKRLEARSRSISYARLAVVVIGAVVAFMLFRSGALNAGTLAVVGFGGVFFLFVRRHDRVEDGLRQTRLLMGIKERHACRRNLDWRGLPDVDIHERDLDDPFAVDLNIVGHRSIHHLLDTSASRGGSAELLRWLTDGKPTPDRVAERQDLVRQLVSLGLFRDHLARVSIAGRGKESARWDDDALRGWLGREAVAQRLKPWLVGLTTFAAVNVALVLGHILGWLPLLWPVTVLAYFAVYFMKHRSVDEVFHEAQDLDMTLDRFRPALLYLERFRFRAGSAADEVTAPLRRSRPSVKLTSLRRIAAFSAVTRNELLWLVFNLLLPWDMLFTYLMHRLKRELREDLPTWLDVWYRVEAASSLAAYADHHPDRSFPEVVADEGGTAFAGIGLGHPLLHEDDKVRNDFAVDRLGQVILITGSNMSGKSTFLRTIGANLRLAYAGGPVDAERLTTTCFRVYTSINVVDSVQEGLSHFYAEVRRLKRLLEALGDEGPQLNLIDEIFRGTNNRERLIGSRAFVHALAGRRAVSFISTHDLELTQMESGVPELSNYHFREDVTGDRMTFDYTIRPGPCPTTNALKIMELAGLPIDAS